MLRFLQKQTRVKWSMSLLFSVLIFGILPSSFAKADPKLMDPTASGIEGFITFQLPKYEKPLLIGSALAKPIYRTAHDLVTSKCEITNLLKELHIDSVIPWFNQEQDQNVIVMMALNDSNEKSETDEELPESNHVTTPTDTDYDENAEEPTAADEASNVSLTNRISSFPMFGTLESADAFHVPDELKLEILNYLTVDELRLSLLVSREWNRISEDAVLWQRNFNDDFTEDERAQALLLYRAVVPGVDQPISYKRLCFIARMLKYTELQAEDIIRYLQIENDDFVVINHGNNISGEELVKKLKELGSKAKGLFVNFRKLTLDDLKAITAFLKNPRSQITHLSLVANGIDAEGVSLIADILERPDCKLTYLSLARNRIGDAGLAVLAKALEEYMCGLIHLDLMSNCIGDSGIKSLVTALRKYGSRLASLNLANNYNIKGDGAWELADFLLESGCSIVRLNLENNMIGPSGAESFAGLLWSDYSRLKELNICDNGIEHKGIKSLAEASVQPDFNLIRLIISCSSTEFNTDSVRVLANAIRDPNFRLQELYVNHSGIDDEAIGLIADALQESNGRLICLDLAYNDIRYAGVRRLANALKTPNCGIEELGLDNNRVGNFGLGALGEALENQNCRLKVLRLRSCYIGDSGARFVSDAIFSENCRLVRLSLWGNDIHASGAKHLADAIKNPRSRIFKLSISHNKIGNKGAKAIAESLKDSGCKVVVICINANNIGASGSRALADVAIAARHQGRIFKVLRDDEGFDEFLKEAEKKYNTSDQDLHDQGSHSGSDQCNIQ